MFQRHAIIEFIRVIEVIAVIRQDFNCFPFKVFKGQEFIRTREFTMVIKAIK